MASIFWHSAFFMVQLSQPWVTTGKTIALTIWTFVLRVMSLLFNTLSRFVTAFLPRSNHPLISWLQSPSAVILEPNKKISVTASIFSSSICHAVMEADIMILVFLLYSLKLAHSSSSFTLIKRLFSSSSLSAFRMVSSACLRLLITASCGEQQLFSSCVAWASHFGGFSCCRAWALGMQAQQLWHTGLVALQHVPSSWTGIEPVSPALAGRLLNHWTTREVPRLNFHVSCCCCC